MNIKNLLFPHIETGKNDRAFYESKYPKRQLTDGAEVTRIAPSPTGELHAGALYMALINRTIAKKSNGVFIVRIEDTDAVREVAGARERMIEYFNYFYQVPDEGLTVGGESLGAYGPYVQSQRTDIYNAFVADFVERGFAYPCFMTADELDTMRQEQQAMKVRPGVYGKYAKFSGITYDAAKTRIENGESYVIRLQAGGDFDKKVGFEDQIMGHMELSENDEHFVIAKSDGVPTYHFANIVDDYLMGVTFVIRANEWVASITKHLELWKKLGVSAPKYGHLMPINKKEGATVRKLSKRKDPEAAVEFYIEKGYTQNALLAYLLRLANPGFDEWWHAGNRDISQYEFNVDELKRNSRGPLLDFQKLDDISSDYIASMSAADVAQQILNWAAKYNTDFYAVISKSVNYLEQVLGIERGTTTARKDIKKWSDAYENIFYFFDELYENYESTEKVSEQFSVSRDIILEKLSSDTIYDMSEDIDAWVLRFKNIATECGYEKFSTFMMDIRVALTSKTKTPNMYYLLPVLGKDRVVKRLQYYK